MSPLLTVGIIASVGLLLLLFRQRLRTGREVHLRPLSSFDALQGQVGQAIESGSRLHISLGRASLIGPANPASMASVTVLDHLAKDGCASGIPPFVTVGEGTLLPIAQGSLRHAYDQAGRAGQLEPGAAQFIANDTDPFAYAGGVANVIQQNKIISNVLVGRFGPELALILEAADRKNVAQIIGTDNPVALSLATAVSNNVLVGEEMFAAGAYLEGAPAQIASLQAQDLLRLVIIITIMGLAIFQLIT